jgi:cytochrome P450
LISVVKRFEPGSVREPLAYMAFGCGPRNCVGMKFGLNETKVTLVKILRKYKVVSTPNTPKTIEYKDDFVMRTPLNKMKILFTKRQ